ncbi:predicted protein [Postia placenta Mad-698-R]|nr:predicted protein [Postia placenta Mad-698-R]
MKRHISAPPEEPARRVGVVVDNVFLKGIINEAKERKERERQTKAVPIPPPRSANPEPQASPIAGSSRPRPDTPIVFRKVDPDWTPDTTPWTWDSSWPRQEHLSGEEWKNVGRNARNEWFNEEEDDGVDWELYGDGEHRSNPKFDLCDRCAGYRSAPVECVWVENATTCERCAQFQQGCYFDKVSVLGKTKKTRGGGSTTKKRIRPASPGPSIADSSGSKKRRVDEPPRPLLRRPLDGASRLGLEQDDLDALDLDDESRGIIRVIREERAHIACRRALLHDMDLDLQKMEKAALAKGGIGFVRGAVDDE